MFFLLSCFLIFMVASLFVKLMLTILLGRVRRRETQTYREYTSASEQYSDKEGEVYVSSVSSSEQEKLVEKDMGEYVDFETVKEE